MGERICSIDDCDRPGTFARGWCGPHYKRWYRHGDPLAEVNRRAPKGATLRQRLEYVGWTEIQVRPTMTPCWEWNGLTDPAGYGRLWDGTRVEAAHRASLVALRGDDVTGVVVQHLCDNPPCMNPDHLERGTAQANTADMVAKKRQANGERKPHKLTDAVVAEIRAKHRDHATQHNLATEYGVSQGYISMLVRGLVRCEPTYPEDARDNHSVGVRSQAV